MSVTGSALVSKINLRNMALSIIEAADFSVTRSLPRFFAFGEERSLLQ